MRAPVLHNPTAGPGDVSADELLDVVGRAGFTPRYTSAKDLEFSAALRDAADLVVVAGGDGTVDKVVRHLPDRTTPLAILPLGGANNIATSLGISDDWRERTVLLRRLGVSWRAPKSGGRSSTSHAGLEVLRPQGPSASGQDNIRRIRSAQ